MPYAQEQFTEGAQKQSTVRNTWNVVSVFDNKPNKVLWDQLVLIARIHE